MFRMTRYLQALANPDLAQRRPQVAAPTGPVVIWNLIRRCNLTCKHCYATSADKDFPGELSTEQVFDVMDDLRAYGVPVLILSGGEPLMRPDIFDISQRAKAMGFYVGLSSNGTLITGDNIAKIAEVGYDYVGVSLDGMREVHDRFRRRLGAFDESLRGIRLCRDVGIKVGLRFTINKFNVTEIPAIFDLLEERNIPRICFYHLVYAGRGSELVKDDLTHEETRRAVDVIVERTKDMYDRGIEKEVLTVDNHADGPYLYLKMQQEQPERAAEVLELLKMNEGNNSGRGFGCISWNGDVHADQFWRHHSFGNVRQRPFSEIWTDVSEPLMKKLKDKKQHVKGRCADCNWLNICAGNFRVRAEAVYDDVWAPDPACYLTDEEIAKESR